MPADFRSATLAGSSASGPQFSREDLPGAVDLVIVLGGDGTLLRSAELARQEAFDQPEPMPLAGPVSGQVALCPPSTIRDWPLT